jgi:hypothetical protein
MSRWRIAVLLVLLAAPVLFWMGAGTWWMWREGLGFILWWPLAGCLAAAYFLAWYWHRQARLLPRPEVQPPPHWTERDRHAWQLVEARARAVKDVPAERLMDLQYYVDTGRDLAQELAAFYHPRSKEPLGARTIPEILAVIQLASEDMAQLVDQYLPGGHLLTINQWRSAPKVMDWYNRASLVYYAISALFSPVETLARYAASQLGFSQPLRMLQGDVLVWFATAYIHRVGTYLVDLNSGRLRVGAKRYRELLAQAGLSSAGMPAPATAAATAAPAPEPGVGAASGPRAGEPVVVSPEHVAEVQLTLTGQVKAGKSSLANALLGERRAITDVLPATSEVTRYQLQPAGVSSQLILLDTVGYAHEGPRADQLKVTTQAVQQSDLVLLVLHARDPARQPDLELLRGLRAHFASRPELKLPPVLAVLTHIDLLPPLMEWSPPYDWQSPAGPKAKSIREALAAVEDQLGDYLAGAIPVCTAEGKVFGVQEWLLPRMAELLGEARAVGLLRCLHAEAYASKVRRAARQLLSAGQQVVRVLTRQVPGPS